MSEFERWYKARQRQTINRSKMSWAHLAWSFKAAQIDEAAIMLQAMMQEGGPAREDIESVLGVLRRGHARIG